MKPDDVRRHDSALLNVLDQVEICPLPWARRAADLISLTKCREKLNSYLAGTTEYGHGLKETSLAGLLSVVNSLDGWQPPICPVQVPECARAAIVLLHHSFGMDLSKLKHILALLSHLSLNEEKRQWLRCLIRASGDAEWTPKALVALRQKRLESDPVARMWSSFTSSAALTACGRSHEFFYLCDSILPTAFFSIPPGGWIWLMLATLLESRTSVFSIPNRKGISVPFFLRSSVIPFRWEHIFIPVLPSTMSGAIVESPTPYLISLRRDTRPCPEIGEISPEIKFPLENSPPKKITHCMGCAVLRATKKSSSLCTLYPFRKLAESLFAILSDSDQTSNAGKFPNNHHNAISFL